MESFSHTHFFGCHLCDNGEIVLQGSQDDLLLVTSQRVRGLAGLSPSSCSHAELGT